MTDSEYIEFAEQQIDHNEWDRITVSTNIPRHPEIRFVSPSGRYEVELSPVNGYDDGQLHEKDLRFFVNVYEHRVGEEDEREEKGVVFSRRKNDHEDAVMLADEKISEYA